MGVALDLFSVGLDGVEVESEFPDKTVQGVGDGVLRLLESRERLEETEVCAN